MKGKREGEKEKEMEASLALSFLATIAKISATILAIFCAITVFILQRRRVFRTKESFVIFAISVALTFIGFSGLVAWSIHEMRNILLGIEIAEARITEIEFVFFVALIFLGANLIMVAYHAFLRGKRSEESERSQKPTPKEPPSQTKEESYMIGT